MAWGERLALRKDTVLLAILSNHIKIKIVF